MLSRGEDFQFLLLTELKHAHMHFLILFFVINFFLDLLFCFESSANLLLADFKKILGKDEIYKLRRLVVLKLNDVETARWAHLPTLL